MLGPNRDEVTGDQRKLHNEKLHNLCSSPKIVWEIQLKKNEMGGACGM
jgi:hypothetical protein